MTETQEKQDEAIRTVFRLKAKMLERKIYYAWTVCPACGGKLRARIAGGRNHVHAACETEGCIRLVE